MKIKILTFIIVVSLQAFSALAQGTMYVYDQQSSTDETPFPGTGGAMQLITSPWGQSFTPSLSAISFIRLKFSDGNINDGLGATIYVNLRSGSIGGSLMGSSAPVAMANNFAGTTTFVFPTDIPLVPGTAYYFEPILQSGGTWNIDAGGYNYPGGSAFANGQPVGSDFWFREGIVVPEPSAVTLLFVGVGIIAYVQRSKGRTAV